MPRPSWILAAVVLTFSLVVPPRSLAHDAVVTILITDMSGARAFGTGFVSSESGDVITCYHVVEGATRISVFYKRGLYDAEIVGIAPDRDTARLHMSGVPLPTEFLRSRYEPPQDLASRPLVVEGYAAGLFDQRLDAHATQNGFALSEQMSDQKGNGLFSVSGIKVLPLKLVVFRGMSGAPLLTQEGDVIGIISGSLTQGGSIAWAIAIENAQPTFTSPVPTVAANLQWPRLARMPVGWENLRSQSGIDKDLIDKVEAVTKAIDAVEGDLNTECIDDNVAVQGLSNLLQTFDRYPALANMPTSVLDGATGDGHDLGTSASDQVDVMNPQVHAAERQLDITLTDVDDLQTKLRALNNAANDFLNNLPATSRNSGIIAQITSQAGVRDAGVRDILKTANEASRQTHQLFGQVKLSPDLISDYQTNYATFLAVWKIYQQTYCHAMPSVLNAFRVDYRLLLNADN
jgi:trypsin-like peptidase